MKVKGSGSCIFVLAGALGGAFATATGGATVLSYAVADGILGASSIGQQLTGMALGAQHGMDWGAVVGSAMVAAATAGVASQLPGAVAAAQVADGATTAGQSATSSYSYMQAFANSEVLGLVREGVGIMTGQIRHPSWRDLAVNALSNAGSEGINHAFSQMGNHIPVNFMKELLKGELAEGAAASIYHRTLLAYKQRLLLWAQLQANR